MSNIKLKIDNFSPIKNADMDIGKINVIGGLNSTGKSTTSKLLYCFLRAVSSNKEQLYIDALYEQFRSLRVLLRRHPAFKNRDFDKLLFRATRRHEVSIDYLYHTYSQIKNAYKEYYYEYNSIFDKNYSDIDEFIDELKYYDIKLVKKNDWRMDNEQDVKNWVLNVQNDFERMFGTEDILEEFKKIDNSFDLIFSESDELYQDIIETLLGSEFGFLSNKKIKKTNDEEYLRRKGNFIAHSIVEIEDELDDDGEVEDKQMGTVSLYSDILDYNYTMDFKEFNFTKQGNFEINEIYYIDSFALFDFERDGLYYSEHVQDLKKALRPMRSGSKKVFDNIFNEKNIKFETIIKNIIGGELKYERGDLVFVNKDNIKTSIKNTASGIKQIGVIQSLISNRKLPKNSFLIIDEPEVNLHPEWQIKFAHILVLLAKELDIQIFIASHSPFLIEAIQLYSEYYELLDDTYFYLTKESDEEGSYNIYPVPSNNIERIYRNLGEPYEILDDLKMQIKFEKKDNEKELENKNMDNGYGEKDGI